MSNQQGVDVIIYENLTDVRELLVLVSSCRDNMYFNLFPVWFCKNHMGIIYLTFVFFCFFCNKVTVNTVYPTLVCIVNQIDSLLKLTLI